MLEQVSTSVKFLAFFTATKQGKTGLTVTVDLYDPSGSQIVTGASATAVGGGLYSYVLSTNNSAEGEYAAIFKTSDSTVDAQHIPSLWVLGRAGVENLDATVSSRSTLTAAQVNTEADTALADVGLTTARAGNLDNLDATVSSRLAPSGTLATVTTLTNAPSVPSASAIASQVRSELSVELSRIDAATSTRATPANIPTAEISAIKGKTDLLNTTRLAQVSTTEIVGNLLAQANS